MAFSRDRLPFIRILISVLIALFMITLPLSKAWQWGQPQWLLLVVIYWVTALPHRFGVLSAWMLGLIFDVTTSGLIGLHAMAMAIIAHLAYVLHQRIRSFPLWQNCLVIFLFVGLYQTIARLIPTLLGYLTPEGLFYYFSALTSALVWPLIFGLLSRTAKKPRYV